MMSWDGLVDTKNNTDETRRSLLKKEQLWKKPSDFVVNFQNTKKNSTAILT